MKVLKKNLAEEVTWQYEGVVLSREENAITLEALFNRDDMLFMDIVLKRNDRFVETFYSDRWYNIFRFHEPEGTLRNYYCNVAMPPTFENGVLDYVDLDIDILVWPDFSFEVVDRDDFELNSLKYNYPDDIKQESEKSVAEIIEMIERRKFPLDHG